MFEFKLLISVFNLTFLFWGVFISLIQIFQIIEIAQLLVWETKIQKWKWNFQWCVCVFVCVNVSVCVWYNRSCDEKVLFSVQKLIKNLRGMGMVFPCAQGNSLCCTVGNILTPIDLSVSVMYIQMMQISHFHPNYLNNLNTLHESIELRKFTKLRSFVLMMLQLHP